MLKTYQLGNEMNYGKVIGLKAHEKVHEELSER